MEKPTGKSTLRLFQRPWKSKEPTSHIPSAPTMTANLTQIQNPKGAFPSSPVLRSLQAHPSIGKDCIPREAAAQFATSLRWCAIVQRIRPVVSEPHIRRWHWCLAFFLTIFIKQRYYRKRRCIYETAFSEVSCPERSARQLLTFACNERDTPRRELPGTDVAISHERRR